MACYCSTLLSPSSYPGRKFGSVTLLYSPVSPALFFHFLQEATWAPNTVPQTILRLVSVRETLPLRGDISLAGA